MPTHPSDDFIDRIQRCYRLATDDLSLSRGDMWSRIDDLRKPIHDALLDGNREFVRAMLVDPITTDLFYGVDNLAKTIDQIHVCRPNIDLEQSTSSQAYITLLAHALGAIRWVPSNAEQYQSYIHQHFAEHTVPDIDDTLDRIQDIVGFPIDFPTPFRGERGCVTNRGVSSHRSVAAIYQAHRLRQELALGSGNRALEIGPGMGRTAYYAHRAGIEYTTVDLPLGIVAQACFLGATLGPDALWVQGDAIPTSGRIRLLTEKLLKQSSSNFDIVLNVDSLTEMGKVEAETYAKWIRSHAKIFLSINVEANEIRVPDIIRNHLPGANYSRFPYWMRPGYSEEIIRISAPLARSSLARVFAAAFKTASVTRRK